MTRGSKKLSGLRSRELKSEETGIDTRPKRSPYASDTCNLYFRGGERLQVHLSFLDVSPKLAAQCSPSFFGGTPLRNLDLDEISIDAGHVVVNFLTTGLYSCLQPHGNSASERIVSELTTAFRVCAAAEFLELPALGDLAIHEVKRVGKEVGLLTIIRIVGNLSPGVASYITARMHEFCETLNSDLAIEVLAEVSTPKNLSELLFKGAVEMKLQQLSSEKTPCQRGVPTGGTAPTGLLGLTKKELEVCKNDADATPAVAVTAPGGPNWIPSRQGDPIREIIGKKKKEARMASRQSAPNLLDKNASERAQLWALSSAPGEASAAHMGFCPWPSEAFYEVGSGSSDQTLRMSQASWSDRSSW